MIFLIGFIIGIFIAAFIDGLVFLYILRNPSIIHKLVKILPGNLLDKWEGEFDVGFYGDDCRQNSCKFEQWSEDENNYDQTK